MLYKLKSTDSKTTFVPVTPTTMTKQGFLEKEMEQWLADNPHAVLPEDEERVLVISQETAFQNLTDILAVDEQGNLLVIEVKRGQTPRDVIAQALEYASAVAEWDYQELNRRATQYFAGRAMTYESLLSAFQGVFDIDPGKFSESQFNQRQRIFIVGEAIEPKIERTARWLLRQGVEVGCISYTCYRTEEKELFLDFQQVVRREDVLVGKVPPIGLTEAEFVENMPYGLQDLYHKLKDRVAPWPNVQTAAIQSGGYLKLTAGNNFAEIYPRKDGLHVYVRREGFSIPKGETQSVHGLAVTHKPYQWTLNHEFVVSSDTDLNAVEILLRQSYDAVVK